MSQGEHSVLRASGLTKRYGSVLALDNVEIAVGEHELCIVLGPTGAGKTTLLRCLAGLVAPDAGRISMAGTDVTGASPAERDLAMVFQNFSLYPRWSVRENLSFPLRAPGRNLAASEIERRVAWAAELLEITALLDRPAARLSGGEMQRVAIGRAVVRQPRAYLLDEPLTNLDAKLREALRVRLVALQQEMQRPMLFVTHDAAEALSMAERIVVLSEGRVLQTGTPDQVYNSPASPTVALQLGDPKVNLFQARAHDGSWVATDGTPLGPCVAPARPDLPGSSGKGIGIGTGIGIGKSDGKAANVRAATVGIRPEHIDALGGERPGRVKIAQYMGATTTLLVEWASQDIHISVEGVARFKPGDVVQPRPHPERLLIWPHA